MAELIVGLIELFLEFGLMSKSVGGCLFWLSGIIGVIVITYFLWC